MKLKQKFLIKRVIVLLGFDNNHINSKNNPAEKPILHKNEFDPSKKHQCYYRLVIIMLNYLKEMRADLDFSVNQYARFFENPRLSHEKAVHKIICYLKSTKSMGMIFTPDQSKGIECYVDADFSSD